MGKADEPIIAVINDGSTSRAWGAPWRGEAPRQGAEELEPAPEKGIENGLRPPA